VRLAEDELERFVEDLAADPSVWARHVRYAPFERTYELIHDGEDVNAWRSACRHIYVPAGPRTPTPASTTTTNRRQRPA
jgi:hypothetical protein